MIEGNLRKMKTSRLDDGRVEYHLRLGDNEVELNPLVGTKIKLEFTGEIDCVHCDRKIKKSFNGGYCYPCFQTLPETDLCIVKPERCHFDEGTCRDSAWGKKHCFIAHTIYLANSSGLKVGITRSHQQTTRWMDQGAVMAMPILRTARRLDAGLVEVAIAKHVSDKTNWRKMLKGEIEAVDLKAIKADLLAHVPEGIEVEAVDEEPLSFEYPVKKYPEKIKSHNFDKNPEVGGLLEGIKGQYLMFDTGVINIRKFAGYRVKFLEE